MAAGLGRARRLGLPLLVDHRLYRADGNLNIRDFPQAIIGGHHVGCRCGCDEFALGCQQPGAESFEFFSHGGCLAGEFTE